MSHMERFTYVKFLDNTGVICQFFKWFIKYEEMFVKHSKIL